MTPPDPDPARDFDSLIETFASLDDLEEAHDRLGGELDPDPDAPGNTLTARRIA